MERQRSRSWPKVAVLLALAGLASVGCASSRVAKLTDAPDRMQYPLQAWEREAAPVVVQVAEPAIAQAQSQESSRQLAEAAQQAEPVLEEYDPWQPFNEGIFTFNRQVDRFVLKPVATVWDKVFPDPAQRGLKNAFENIGMPRRVVNSLAQGKARKTAGELARFVINSTLGVAGFFDVAKSVFGLELSEEDTGQTLGFYGIGPGPYLIVPLLPPLTVRDAIGYVVDLALDPANYFLPFVALASMTIGRTVDERSLTLEFYQDVEESVLDLYSAVRNGYLQRRQKQIKE